MILCKIWAQFDQYIWQKFPKKFLIFCYFCVFGLLMIFSVRALLMPQNISLNIFSDLFALFISLSRFSFFIFSEFISFCIHISAAGLRTESVLVFPRCCAGVISRKCLRTQKGVGVHKYVLPKNLSEMFLFNFCRSDCETLEREKIMVP